MDIQLNVNKYCLMKWFTSKQGEKMRKLLYLILFAGLVFTGCESPMDIDVIELEDIEGTLFNRQLLKDGNDFSIGYENGNIRTSQVALSWGMITDENFKFYKILCNGDERAVFDNEIHTSWIDSLCAGNTIYEYELIVFANNGMADFDTILIKTPRWDSPGNLNVYGVSQTDVRLTWIDNSESEENFQVDIYHEFSDIPIDSYFVAANVTELIVSDLDPMTYYRFNVKATNSWENVSDSSEMVSCDMSSLSFDPPSNLYLQLNNENCIDLDWQDNSTLESGFTIERKRNTSSFEEIAIVNRDTYYFTDTDTLSWTAGDTITYRVRGYNDFNGTDYTDYCVESSIYIVDMNSDLVVIQLQVDNYPAEATWNIFDYTTSSLYYPTDRTFTYSYQSVTKILDLPAGTYALVCDDSNSNGGISGNIIQSGVVLREWDADDYNMNRYFIFDVE